MKTAIKEHHSELENKLTKISKNYEFANFIKKFSEKNDLNIFFDSEDYFALIDDYSMAEDFSVRKKNILEKDSYCDNFREETIHYFDFFINLDSTGKKSPLYIREEKFLENKLNIIYSRFFSHYERDHQIHWTKIEEIEKISHPEKIDDIISYYKNKGLNRLILKNLEKKIILSRKENPEIYKPKCWTAL